MIAGVGRVLAWLSITAAFILFLCCSISTPVTPSRFPFLSYVFAGEKALKIGMWGSCTWDVSPTGGLSGRNCTDSKLGFLVDLRNLPGRQNNGNPFVVGNLSKALVLYPIATGLAFLGVLTTLVNPALGLLNCQGAVGLAGAAMIIHFILFERTDGQVREAFGSNVTGGLAVAEWMGLTGTLLAGVATLMCILGSARETTRKHGSMIKDGGV